MMDMSRNEVKKMLTKRERLVLDILKSKKFISEGEEQLKKHGIGLSSAYKIVERVRRKGIRWRMGVNQVLSYRRRSELLNKRLRPVP